MTLEKNLEMATKIIQNGFANTLYLRKFEQIYPFANENLKAAFKNFDFTGKKCLTVLASSDQALEMISKGAKKIVTFDINPLTKYYFELKKAALIANFSLEEYLNYFSYYQEGYPNLIINKESFNQSAFAKIKPYLEKESYLFWHYLYQRYEPLIIRKCLFSYDEINQKTLPKSLSYLENNNFIQLKKRIKNIKNNFIISNVTDLPKFFQEKQDYIYLSNIIQYAEELFPPKMTDYITQETYQKEALNYYKKHLEQIKSLLNTQGYLLGGYIYSSNIDDEMVAIFNSKVRQAVFNQDLIISFPSIESFYPENSFSKDSLLILKKD